MKFAFVYSLALVLASATLGFGSKSTQDSSGEGIWVMRPDGGKMCDSSTATSVETGAEALKKAHIKILDSQKGHDGKLHAQVCGIPAGSVNVYQISKNDVSKALELGYQLAPEKK